MLSFNNRRRHRDTSIEFRSILIPAAVFLLLSACAAPSRIGAPPGDLKMKKTASMIWKSEDYTVLMTNIPVSSTDLADEFMNDPDLAWKIEDYNGRDHFGADSEVVIPMTGRQPLGVYPDRYQVVPVLCYHRFGDNIKNKLVLPGSDFEKQMKYLKENGYRVIPLSHLEEFLDGKRDLPKRSVVITVDDGYKSFYTVAFPILIKYGFPATLFIYTDYIGTGPGSLSWAELREMEKTGLIDTQNHTRTHANLPKIHSMGNKAVMSEILGPSDLISRKLEHEAAYLAYPYGNTNPSIIQLSKEAGLRVALTVTRGSNAFFENPWQLKRNMIFSQESFGHFLENLSVEEKLPE